MAKLSQNIQQIGKSFGEMGHIEKLGSRAQSTTLKYTCNSNKCYTPHYAPGPANSTQDQYQLSNSNPKVDTKSSEPAFV